MMGPASLRSVEDARALLSRFALPAVGESVALDDALGRTLLRDVRADRDLPPFDRAAVDGYAVSFEGAWRAGGLYAELGRLAAGQVWRGRLRAGEAVRIMTGAPVPPGARAVVMVERSVPIAPGQVQLRGELDGAHPGYAPRGQDARRRDVLIRRGVRLEPSHLAVLASVGTTDPWVATRASVAIVTTGDEVVGPGETPRNGQIRNSNATLLRALLAPGGCARVSRTLCAGDTLPALRRALERAAGDRIVVLTGGVSRGDFDRVPDALRAQGYRVHVHGVALRPGKPFLFATRGAGRARQAAFALPGNPVSVLVTAHEFLLPYLRAAAGEASGGASRDVARGAAARMEPWRWRARVRATIERRPGLSHFILGVSSTGRDGVREVAEVRSNGSGDFVAASRADCLIPLDARAPRAEAGAVVDIHPLFREAWRVA